MKPVNYVRPVLYDKQERALFTDARYSIIEGSTKSGKTHGSICWLFEQAIVSGKPGYKYWWVAPTYSQSKIAYERMKRYATPRDLFKFNDSELTIELFNQSKIEFKTGEKPDNLYGDDVYACIVDEASRCREESWYAIRSTLTATKGSVRLIGNVKGRGNFFYKLARRAESGEPGMEYHVITALDAVNAGILDAEEIEDAKRQLPERVFNELYLCQPGDDEGNPFGIGNINLRIKPLSAQKPVIFGIDLAKSFDHTVIIGLDDHGSVCYFDRFQSDWQNTMERINAIVSCQAIIDSTGVGDPIVEQLKRINPQVEGFKFTAQSKQMIMEGLAVSIQQGRISYPSGPIVNELETFEYNYTRTGGVKYSAPDGLHDDCVCALALANYGMGHKKTVGQFLGSSLQSHNNSIAGMKW